MNQRSTFPEIGHRREAVLGALAEKRSHDLQSDGRAFAFFYDPGEDAKAVAREAFTACMGINGLDPTAFPSSRTIENAVVAPWLELLHGPKGSAGTATAGGTESVMLAVKAARDWSRKARPEITAPKMLLPITAHACFHKAAHYLGVEVVTVEVDPVTFRASVEDARAKMTKDVILVVGSAPSYAHGVIDPIAELAALASSHGALMHVDACVGGCVLPFLRETGKSVPDFDFRVEGVTSISLDLHKYGFAPKGASLLLMRTRALRDAQYFTCGTWTGYTVINSTMLGSKSLAALGAAFALMGYLGKKGYRDRAKTMWDATQSLVSVIESTPGLKMLGRPDMNLFAFTTEEGDVFELADRLAARGWHVQPTYSFGPSPAHIHLTIDPTNAARASDLAADLRGCVVDLPKKVAPPAELIAMLMGIASSSEGVDAGAIMAQFGFVDGLMPSHTATIHRLMEAAPPEVRESLVGLFIGELFS